MKDRYIMALDQGTTSARCILYDRQGKQVSIAQKEFRQIYPQAGWVEHDPMDIWSTQIGVAQEALLKIDATYKNIDAIGITNQRETTVVWDRYTGEPIYSAIVRQCRRTAEYCDSLKAKGLEASFRRKTGLLIDPYFSGTKLRWILGHVDGAWERAKNGDLLFGTIETWLIWKLTDGKVHVTDYSNASRTMMFNIHDLKWDEDILKKNWEYRPVCCRRSGRPVKCMVKAARLLLFGRPVPISERRQEISRRLCLVKHVSKREKLRIHTEPADLCWSTQEMKPVDSRNGLITTIAWGVGNKVQYALEGSVFISGATIQWLRDELKILDNAAESEKHARMVEDTAGAYVVPAFTGLGAPYWDSYARGAIMGLTRGVNKNHIIRAALESMAYQTNDLMAAMEEDMGHPLQKFKVDGGASANDFCWSFRLVSWICQCIGRSVSRQHHLVPLIWQDWRQVTGKIEMIFYRTGRSTGSSSRIWIKRRERNCWTAGTKLCAARLDGPDSSRRSRFCENDKQGAFFQREKGFFLFEFIAHSQRERACERMVLKWVFNAFCSEPLDGFRKRKK